MSFIKKDLHIVFRFADRVLLDSAVFNPDEIILLKLVDNLTIGPVCNLERIDGIKTRKSWLEKAFGDLAYKEDLLSAVDMDTKTMTQISEAVDKCKDIYIWTGCDASEVIGTARVLKNSIKQNKSIYVLDFSKVQVVNIKGEIVSPKSLLQTASFQIKDVFKHFKLQKSVDIRKWKDAWDEIESEQSLLRILTKDCTIVHKPASFFDSVILSICTKEFQKAARVLGQALVEVDFSVGDGYINWRLKELVKEKKLESRGPFTEIRDYEVRTIN